MVIGPHHATVTHVGDSSEVGQREHAHGFGWVFTESAGLSFCVCLGDYLAPPRQVCVCVWGGAPWDALGRHPSVDPRSWRPAGGPVVGAQLGIEPLDAKRLWHHAGHRIPTGK
jgi:hypothetical protein